LSIKKYHNERSSTESFHIVNDKGMFYNPNKKEWVCQDFALILANLGIPAKVVQELRDCL